MVNVSEFIEGYVMRGRSRAHGTIRKQIPLIGRQFRTASEHRNPRAVISSLTLVR
jgi:hypothetical protein